MRALPFTMSAPSSPARPPPMTSLPFVRTIRGRARACGARCRSCGHGAGSVGLIDGDCDLSSARGFSNGGGCGEPPSGALRTASRLAIRPGACARTRARPSHGDLTAMARRARRPPDSADDVSLLGSPRRDGRGDDRRPGRFLRPHAHLLARHALFRLEVAAKAIRSVNDHHTVEGRRMVALGQAFAQRWRKSAAFHATRRCICPWTKRLTRVSIDISGRPFLVLPHRVPDPEDRPRSTQSSCASEFQAFRP